MTGSSKVFVPDPVVEVYKKDVDRTLLWSNLQLSPEDRVRKLQDFVRLMISLRQAGQASKP
jgi:hypothetical protein